VIGKKNKEKGRKKVFCTRTNKSPLKGLGQDQKKKRNAFIQKCVRELKKRRAKERDHCKTLSKMGGAFCGGKRRGCIEVLGGKMAKKHPKEFLTGNVYHESAKGSRTQCVPSAASERKKAT